MGKVAAVAIYPCSNPLHQNCVRTCVRVFVCARARVCVRVSTCVYRYVRVWMSMCTYVYVHVYAINF